MSVSSISNFYFASSAPAKYVLCRWHHNCIVSAFGHSSKCLDIQHLVHPFSIHFGDFGTVCLRASLLSQVDDGRVDDPIWHIIRYQQDRANSLSFLFSLVAFFTIIYTLIGVPYTDADCIIADGATAASVASCDVGGRAINSTITVSGTCVVSFITTATNAVAASLLLLLLLLP